ncbi:exosortase family protein XrtF [Fulvivirga kasyanovii]|nr:exosortase family protein XrtF [Fulvivirga kasyanovii]
MSVLKEFKPTILFLVKFLTLYLVLNFSYVLFIEYHSPEPDPFTRLVTQNTTFLLSVMGFDISYRDHPERMSISIYEKDEAVINVFEGCNGLNVGIIFASFLLAFGTFDKKLFWFIPLGLLIIHISNLARIIMLFCVAMSFPSYMYFAHKYLFTAIIYLVVFILWYVWVTKLQAPFASEHA